MEYLQYYEDCPERQGWEDQLGCVYERMEDDWCTKLNITCPFENEPDDSELWLEGNQE